MKQIQFTLIPLLAFLLASCGGSAKASTTINVTMTDFQFTPNVFTVPAGKEITLNAANNGSVVHNFIIMKLGTSAGDSWETDDDANVYWKTQLDPGATQTATFTAPTDPGDYQIVCSTPGHIASGMIATLKVVANQ